MEGRARKHSGGHASPERTARPWPEGPPPPPLQHLKQSPVAATAGARRIPVVYYLCRNRHLEHPHFIEVPFSSPDGLYLRDVINRLNVLRGKGMAAMYSWSCKRSYKNGFVWHDLSEDDLVLPAQGNEYVLKGSELLDQSPSDRILQSSDIPKLQNVKHSQQQNHPNLRNQEASCSSSSLPYTTVRKELKPPPSPPTPREDERSPLLHRPGSSGNTSPELQTSSKPSSCDADSPKMAEYRLYNSISAANASTQTEDSRGRTNSKVSDTCTRGISTDDCPIGVELQERLQNTTPSSKDDSDTCYEEISRPLTSSSASSSSAKTETLESLIRADARKMNAFKIVEEEEVLNLGPRLRATNLLMQLITCGSISVKDHHNFGLISTYKPKFSHVKFPSPKLSSSVLLGELDCLSENPRLMGMRFEEKEYFSGSLIETKKHNVVGEIMPTLKRSSSYNGDRSCKSPDSSKTLENTVDSSRSKCLPRTIKITSNRHSRTEPAKSPLSTSNRHSRIETAKSPLSDGSRSSSAGQDQLLKDGNMKMMESSAENGLSTRVESFKEQKEKIIKIEERLISGARVIIQSRATANDSEEGSDS